MTFFVYTIKCSKNNKLYVGITNNISARWNKHIYDSRHNSQCVIHRAIRKYGEDSFSLNIIEECSTKDILLEQEKQHIQLLKSHVSLGGYNETWGGEAPMLGRTHTTKSKQKISDKLKGRVSPNKGKKVSLETRQKLSKSHSKPVVQLSLNDQVIAVHKSVTAASRATNIADSNISGVCRNKKKSAGGFHWRYLEN